MPLFSSKPSAIFTNCNSALAIGTTSSNGEKNWKNGKHTGSLGKMSPLQKGSGTDRGLEAATGTGQTQSLRSDLVTLNVAPPPLSFPDLRGEKNCPSQLTVKGYCRNITTVANICIAKLPGFIFYLKVFLQRVKC